MHYQKLKNISKICIDGNGWGMVDIMHIIVFNSIKVVVQGVNFLWRMYLDEVIIVKSDCRGQNPFH